MNLRIALVGLVVPLLLAGVVTPAAAVKGAGAVKVGPLKSVRGVDQRSNDLVAIGSTLYFARKDADHGLELWSATHGKASLAVDIRKGKKSGDPWGLRNVDGTLLFFATGDNGVVQLWSYEPGDHDATALAEVSIGSTNQAYLEQAAAVVGGRYFFPGADDEHGGELWVSDGTPSGTRLIKDIRPGWAHSNISSMVVLGNRVYFFANDGTHGSEMWTSDGTPAGTRMVKDVNRGPGSGYGGSLGVIGTALVFPADRGRSIELWVSDGTSKGTKVLRDEKGRKITGIIDVMQAVYKKSLYLTAYTTVNKPVRLYRTNGTAKGTKLVSTALWPQATNLPFGIFDVIGFSGGVIFQGYDPKFGTETRISDGTAKGTRVVQEVIPGPVSTTHISQGLYGVDSWPDFVVKGKWVYFQAPYKVGAKWTMQLARTNGKKIERLTNLPVGKTINHITVAGNDIYFATVPYRTGSKGRELWLLR